MDFSTKAKEAISMVVAEEIKDVEGLENGLREMLKEAGAQAYGKVLERKADKLASE